jgi:branched-chain amino acid transport system substrate-binding protein
LSTPASAESDGPIKFVVIAEATAVAGSSIPQAAQPVADEINAAGSVNGRKIEIVSYDDHSSAPEAVRAFQRAADRRLLGELMRGRTARRGYPRRLENNMLRT